MSEVTSAGAIKLDVEVEAKLEGEIEEQAKKIALQIKKQLGKMKENMFSSLSKSFEAAMNSMVDTIEKQTKNAEKIMDNFVKNMQKISKVKIAGPNIQMNEVENDSSNSILGQNNISSRGPPNLKIANPKIILDDQFKSEMLQEEIEILKGSIQSLENSLASLNEKRKQAYNKGYEAEILKDEKAIISFGEQVEKLDKTIAKYTDNMNRAKITLEGYKRSQKALEESQKSSIKSIDNYSKATKKATRSTNSSRMSVGNLIKSFTIFSLIFPLVSRGIMALGTSMWQSLMANDAFNNSVNQIRTNLSAAFMPIYQFVMPALNALMNGLAKATAYVASFISALFGMTYSQSVDATSGLVAAKDAMGAYGSAAKKAGKDVKSAMNATLGIDELNIAQKNDTPSTESDGGSGGSKAPSIVPTEIDTSPVDKAVQYLKGKISKLTSFYEKHRVGILSTIGAIVGGLGAFFIINDIIPTITSMTTWLNNLWSVLKVGPAGWQALITSMSGMTLPATAVVTVVALLSAAFVQLWLTCDEWKAKVILAFQNVQAVLSSVWKNVIQPIFNGIIALALTVWEGGLKPLWEAFVELVRVISSAMLDLWNFLSPYILEALEYLGPIFNDAFQLLGVIVGTVINSIIGFITMGIKAITGAVDLIVLAISDAKASFEQILLGIRQIFTGLIDFITGVFTGNWEQAISGIVNIFKGIWNSLVGIVSGVWDIILSLFSNGGKIFSGVVDGIANVFKNIVNTLITGINRVMGWPFNKINDMLNRIRDISVLGMEPFSGLWSYNPIAVPQIPYLAKGGIISQPTLAMVGERGKEAVMPLENNTGWIDSLADKLSTRMSIANSGSMNDYIIIELLNRIIQLLEELDLVAEFDVDGLVRLMKAKEKRLGKQILR